MENIKITRYKTPEKVGWQGYMEDESCSWIGFIDLEGKPVFFLNRDENTGAVK